MTKMKGIFTIIFNRNAFRILGVIMCAVLSSGTNNAMAAYCSFTRNPTSCSPIYTGSNCKTGEYVRADS
ncbi:MAG: hypothetical protein KBS86_00385, partial [Proteobacteria bacterium]|nr:hypothetical protein [Candidatus Enterousia scatequi]